MTINGNNNNRARLHVVREESRGKKTTEPIIDDRLNEIEFDDGAQTGIAASVCWWIIAAIVSLAAFLAGKIDGANPNDEA